MKIFYTMFIRSRSLYSLAAKTATEYCNTLQMLVRVSHQTYAFRLHKRTSQLHFVKWWLFPLKIIQKYWAH